MPFQRPFPLAGSFFLPLLALALLAPGGLRAVNYTWNGSASKDYANPLNWTPNGLPQMADNVTINNGDTVVVTSTARVTRITLFDSSLSATAGAGFTAFSANTTSVRDATITASIAFFGEMITGRHCYLYVSASATLYPSDGTQPITLTAHTSPASSLTVNLGALPGTLGGYRLELGGGASVSLIAGSPSIHTQDLTISASGVSISSDYAYLGGLQLTGARFSAGVKLTVTALNLGAGGLLSIPMEARIESATGTGSVELDGSGSSSPVLRLPNNGSLPGLSIKGGRMATLVNPNLNVSGDLSFTGTAVCSLPNANLTVSGNVANYALGVSTPAGTLTLNGSGRSVHAGGALLNFNHLVIGGSLALASGTVKAWGNLSITAAGALNVNGQTLKAAGAFSNFGSASLGLGTVVLDGANQALAGANSFNHLSKTTDSTCTLVLPAGLTQTVSGTLTLAGAPTELLRLRSSVAGQTWGLNLGGAYQLGYLDVKDSNNVSAAVINAVGQGNLDSGNNPRWAFVPSPTPSPSATLSATPSLSPSPSPAGSATATRTPTASPSPTQSANPTASPSPTETSPPGSPSPSPSATTGPLFLRSPAGRTLAGPVPAKVGEPLCLYFSAAPASSHWRLYNSAAELVSSQAFGSQARHCADTAKLAPGLYYLVGEQIQSDGTVKTLSQKVVLVP